MIVKMALVYFSSAYREKTGSCQYHNDADKKRPGRHRAMRGEDFFHDEAIDVAGAGKKKKGRKKMSSRPFSDRGKWQGDASVKDLAA
jgi:hypothetical protein